MMIPEMDGLELAGRIRRTPALSGIRLLILSSAGYPDDPVRNQELDITQCLIKPVKQSELLHAITNALGLASIVHTPREQGVASRLEPILPRHILLAEDGLVNQKVVIDMLTQRGHTVVVANHGKEALEALEHTAFDLILMDVHMPEMDGFEATAAIRAKERTTGTHIPIIAITASAMKGDRERCLAAGMDGYLAKPMHAADLYRAVEEVVPRVAGGQKSAPATTAALINAADTVGAEIAAVLDWKKALEQFEGNEAFLQRMVHLFLVECPKLMTGARAAMAQENMSELRRIVHILKGSADMFAAQPTGALALRLETLVQEGPLADVEDAWRALEEAITHLLSALSAWVRRERA
jgi:CheY-like chemotaxis protein